MTIEILSTGNFTHTLFVNGKPTVIRESFAVCDSVKFALEHPRLWEPTEAFEVADKIRDSLDIME